jgi:hypothetical protein
VFTLVIWSWVKAMWFLNVYTVRVPNIHPVFCHHRLLLLSS